MNHSTIAAIGAFLAEQKNSIVEEWLQRMGDDPLITKTDELSRSEITDHLPPIIEALITQIHDVSPGQKSQDIKTEAREHGQHRWRQHFQVAEVIWEVALMRRIILRRLINFEREHAAARDDVEIARDITHVFFDKVALHSVIEFAQLQKKALAKADRDLLIANQNLTELDERRLRTIRIAAHEIRNYLNSIQMVASVLTAECASPASREYLAMMHADIERMALFTGDLQDFTNLVSSGTSRSVETFEPSDLFDEACVFIHELAKRKGLVFRSSCDPSIGTVQSDKRRVHSIVINLATNAIKYTPTGEVALAFDNAGNDHWNICVADTGPGIPETDLEHVFEEFYRVPGTAHVPGSGLGLAISKEIVRSLHGTIKVESNPGEGTKFIATLPKRSA